MAESSVCVSILHWFSRERTTNCLDSVLESDHDPLRVVLVNNGLDSEVRHFEAEYPEITVINTGGNVGFAPGHNRGLAVAGDHGDDYVFFLNNDAVLEPDTISTLIEAAEREGERTILSPYVYTENEDGERKLEFTAGYFDWVRGEPYSYASELTEDARPLPDPLAQGDIDYLHGAALFGRTDEIAGLGGFEEKFFIYYEDSDLSQCAKEQGFSLVPVPESEVHHLDYDDLALQVFEDFRAYFILRNKVWFMNRHAPKSTLPVFFLWYFCYRFPRHFYYAFGMDGGARHAKFATYGVLAALTGTTVFERKVRDVTNSEVYQAAFKDS